MWNLQGWPLRRPWEAVSHPLQQESESTEAWVIEVVCLKHAQTLKFPAWWVPDRSSGQRHSSEPTYPGLAPQTLCYLSVNHRGYCPEGLSTMPNGHPEDYPPRFPLRDQQTQAWASILAAGGRTCCFQMLWVTSKPHGECGTTDWPHQVPT